MKFTTPARVQLAAVLKDPRIVLAMEGLFNSLRLQPGDLVFAGKLSSTVTITIASPAVISWPSHGFQPDAAVVFNTTSALPTGLVAGTVYFVQVLDEDTFAVSATVHGTAITTSGSQSGTHTGFAADHPQALLANGDAVSRLLYADLFTAIGTSYGVGDGSTTFNLPDVPALAGCRAFIVY